jgi:quercetin dioxygenase-like cupin family protein
MSKVSAVEVKMEHSKEEASSENLVAQAVRLIDLVDYQEGSVVSRTIVNKKTGTVTLFAFDEGQGLSEHTAPFDALVYLLDGEAEIIISGQALYLKEGEMVIMPARQPHALKAVKRFKMILTMIRS